MPPLMNRRSGQFPSSGVQFTMSFELEQRLVKLAAEKGTTLSDVCFKALTLYIAAVEHEERGLKVGFALPDQPLEIEVTGL